MSSLAATLLAQSSGTVRTRQALIITGLQNDFISPDGKLPINTKPGFIDRIKELVPAFREHGNIIWVWTEYRGNRTVNDPSGNGCRVLIPKPERPLSVETDPSREQKSLPGATPAHSHKSRTANSAIQRALELAADLDLVADDEGRSTDTSATSSDSELFLLETPTREACCKPGTWGAEPIPEVKDLIDPKDVQITKSFYSAFSSTSLLLQLRAKLVTDLYFAGCNTNLSIYATATDVARHGLEINLVQDCLGCRQTERHNKAVREMVTYMGAELTTAHSVISRLRGEELPDDHSSLHEGSGVATDGDDDSDGDAEHSTGPVRQPFLSPKQSESSILSEDSSSTAVIDHLHTSVAPAEHAEPQYAQSAADADRYSFIGDAKEDRFQETASARKLGRGRVGTAEGLSLAKVSQTNDGASEADRHRLEAALNLDENITLGESVAYHHQSSAPVVVAFSADLQTDVHGSLTNAINLPFTPDAMSLKKPHEQAANVCGDTWHTENTNKPTKNKKSWNRTLPALGPGDAIGSGDSSIVYNLLPPELSDTIFLQLLYEVHWQRMYHAAGEVPRLVCCQGDVDAEEGYMPVYRHPSDQSMPLLHYSPAIARVRREAERRVGHRLNHVLIQMYRDGHDHISEHTDKTLDIVPGSHIVNVSFGAQRTIRLRTKRADPGSDRRSTAADGHRTESRTDAASTVSLPIDGNNGRGNAGRPRTTQRIPMPHNSMFVMGSATNQMWLHGIAQDKRLAFERSEAELAYNGTRISLTFRHIGTYLSSDSRLIWGQGATCKEQRAARSVINNNEKESQKLIDAFGTENQSTSFDWHKTYGAGFDVLHLKSPPDDDKPLLFLSGDEHADLSVRLYLAHLGVTATELIASIPTPSLMPLRASMGSSVTEHPARRTVMFRDTDTLHTQVEGTAAILLYLDRAYAHHLLAPSPAILGQAAREVELLTSSTLAELRELLLAQQDRELAEDKLQSVHALHDLNGHLLDANRQLSRSSDRSTCETLEDGWKMSVFESQVGTRYWLAGREFGIADCAFWPLVQALREPFPETFARVYPGLNEWAGRVQNREEIG